MKTKNKNLVTPKTKYIPTTKAAALKAALAAKGIKYQILGFTAKKPWGFQGTGMYAVFHLPHCPNKQFKALGFGY